LATLIEPQKRRILMLFPKKSLIPIIVLILFLTVPGAPMLGNIIHVPDDQPTIQAGIDAAADGDTVLVSQGTYTENINFHGKGILVASHYILDLDSDFIDSTVIDGSQPTNEDTASCVLFITDEDSTSVLQGFTLRGGTGTRWRDEHGAGIYVEGGGILCALSSPVIKNNVITGNEAIRRPPGTVSAGGGGIRCGDGSPQILNNVITSNSAMYGGGIVMNYASGTIRNNIITDNRVYEAVVFAPTFGGGGIWCNRGGSTNIIENNTIFGNSSSGTGSGVAGRGGGIVIWLNQAEIRNNIVWNNTQDRNEQIWIEGSITPTLEYNDIEGGWEGEGNIDVDPSFRDTLSSDFHLMAIACGDSVDSPCIDVGDPSILDRLLDCSWGLGDSLSDMGAYGGGYRIPGGIGDQKVEPQIPRAFSLSQNYPNPFNPSTTIRYSLSASSRVDLKIYNLRGQMVRTLIDQVQKKGSYSIFWNGRDKGGRQVSSGIYIYRLNTGKDILSRKMLLLK
jgi:hypothetical protein